MVIMKDLFFTLKTDISILFLCYFRPKVIEVKAIKRGHGRGQEVTSQELAGHGVKTEEALPRWQLRPGPLLYPPTTIIIVTLLR